MTLGGDNSTADEDEGRRGDADEDMIWYRKKEKHSQDHQKRQTDNKLVSMALFSCVFALRAIFPSGLSRHVYYDNHNPDHNPNFQKLRSNEPNHNHCRNLNPNHGHNHNHSRNHGRDKVGRIYSPFWAFIRSAFPNVIFFSQIKKLKKKWD